MLLLVLSLLIQPLLTQRVQADKRPLTIVTSIKPLALLTRELAGDNAGISHLLPDSVSPHHMSLKPSDIRIASQADLLIWVGPLEGSVLDKLGQRLPTGARLRLIPGAGAINRSGATDEHNPDTDHHHDHHAADAHSDTFDEAELHPWLAPDDIKRLARRISNQLSALDPVNSENYRLRLATFIERLDELENERQQAISLWRETPFVAMHNAYGHLVAHYGLKQVGLVQKNSHEAPGLRHLMETGMILNKSPGHCLLADPFSPQETLNFLQQRFDSRVVVVDLAARDADSFMAFYAAITDSLQNCLQNGAIHNRAIQNSAIEKG